MSNIFSERYKATILIQPVFLVSCENAKNFGDCHAVDIFAITDKDIDDLQQLCRATEKILIPTKSGSAPGRTG